MRNTCDIPPAGFSGPPKRFMAPGKEAKLRCLLLSLTRTLICVYTQLGRRGRKQELLCPFTTFWESLPVVTSSQGISQDDMCFVTRRIRTKNLVVHLLPQIPTPPSSFFLLPVSWVFWPWSATGLFHYSFRKDSIWEHYFSKIVAELRGNKWCSLILDIL